MSDSDDDVPTLSAHTLAALREFYHETRTRPDQDKMESDPFAVGAVEEDWRMSQFWYSDETAALLAERSSEKPEREAGSSLALAMMVFAVATGYVYALRPCLKHLVKAPSMVTICKHLWAAAEMFQRASSQTKEASRIACVSAPSVYQKLKQGVVDGSDRVSAFVLEYDRRFATYADDFIFYDYNEPLSLPSSVAPQSFDIVLADPPYLSEECLSKVAKTIKYLSKGKVLLCTGAIMENVAKELLDVKMCSFLPKHNRNLSNEFRCFINYPSSLLWS